MRVYPDGWKVGTGHDLCHRGDLHYTDDCVLVNPAGGVIAGEWIRFGGMRWWGYRQWVRHSPYGRARGRHWLAVLLCLASCTAAFLRPLLLPESFIWPIVALETLAIVHVLWRTVQLRRATQEVINGSNRKTQADHPHPQTVGTTAAGPTAAAVAAAGAGTGEATGLTLAVVEDDMPILAHRYAKILQTETGLVFGTTTSKGVFGVDALAACRRDLDPYLYMYDKHPPRHDAPGEDCDCGFYAVPADKLPLYEGYDTGVSLLVELSGKVIEHEYGYRAEHQRVVQVAAPHCCACTKPATRAWRNPTENGSNKSLVWDCAGHDIAPIASNSPVMAMSLADVSSLLGVPVVPHSEVSDA